MDCQGYLARFSDLIDGRAEPDVAREMETHRSTCDGCRRYSDTLAAGRDLLRARPALDVPPDFGPRLDHRIFHLEDGAVIAKEALGTGATTISVLAVAILVAIAAWAPAVDPAEPSIELPTVVVDGPPAPSFPPVRPVPTFYRDLSLFGTTEFQDGIWGNSHNLLRNYSPILERRRSQALVRLGIE